MSADGQLIGEERLAEIRTKRKRLGDRWDEDDACHAFLAVHDLLAEVDRLRALTTPSFVAVDFTNDVTEEDIARWKTTFEEARRKPLLIIESSPPDELRRERDQAREDRDHAENERDAAEAERDELRARLDEIGETRDEWGQKYRGGGYLTRPDTEYMNRIYPLPEWINHNTRYGAIVGRRRIIVVEDWHDYREGEWTDGD